MSANPAIPPNAMGFGGYKPDLIAILASFLMHSGSRHLSFELTDAQKLLLSQPTTKAIIMFAMFYISTRNIKWSLILCILYFLAMNMLLNENHPLNIFSPAWLSSKGLIKNEGFFDIGPNYNETYIKNLKNMY